METLQTLQTAAGSTKIPVGALGAKPRLGFREAFAYNASLLPNK